MSAWAQAFLASFVALLGVMLPLRAGWLVAECGWFGAMVVAALCTGIATVSAVSAGTLTAHLRTGDQDWDKLLSNGLEVGGAILMPLLAGQVFAAALGAMAVAEVLSERVIGVPPFLLAPLVLALGTWGVAEHEQIVKSLSRHVGTRAGVLVLVILAMAGLYLGVQLAGPRVPPLRAPTEDVGLAGAVSVWFAGSIGGFSGLVWSNPRQAQAERRGWWVAGGFVLFVQAAVFVVLSNVGAEATIREASSWMDASALPVVTPLSAVAFGALLCTGALMAGPRSLRTLAAEKLAPPLFARPERSREAVWLCAGLAALSCLVFPSLNLVAMAASVAFLAAMATLNTATAIDTALRDSRYRTDAPVSWGMSLAGAASCGLVLVLIQPALGALIIAAQLMFSAALLQGSLRSTWGDARAGLFMTGARWALVSLRTVTVTPRAWRPQIVVFSEGLLTQVGVVRLADTFGQHRGLVAVVAVVSSQRSGVEASLLRERQQRLFQDGDLESAFAEVIVSDSPDSALLTAAQALGVSGVRVNTAMFLMGDQPQGVARQLALGRSLAMVERSTVLVRVVDASSRAKDVVVWWKGRQHNGDLMLLLARLLVASREWRDHRVVLKSVLEGDETPDERRLELQNMVEEGGMNVDVEVVIPLAGEALAGSIRRNSQDARFVFLGLPYSAPGDELRDARSLLSLVAGLPSTIIVRNAGPFRWRLT